MSAQNAHDVVYGMVGGDLVLLLRPEAERLSALRGAVRSASTWGQLRQQLSSHLFDEVREQCREDFESEPEDDEPFSSDHVPGYADGDWPEWPKQSVRAWMPKHVQQEFGRVEDSVLNGEFLQLDPDRTNELVSALATEGFTCAQDDLLTARAAGH